MPTTINPFNPVVGANDLTVTPLAPQEALPTDLQQLLSSADKAAPVPAPAKKEAEPEAPSDIQQLLKDSQGVPEETAIPSQPEPVAPQEGETSRAEDDYKRKLDEPGIIGKSAAALGVGITQYVGRRLYGVSTIPLVPDETLMAAGDWVESLADPETVQMVSNLTGGQLDMSDAWGIIKQLPKIGWYGFLQNSPQIFDAIIATKIGGGIGGSIGAVAGPKGKAIGAMLGGPLTGMASAGLTEAGAFKQSRMQEMRALGVDEETANMLADKYARRYGPASGAIEYASNMFQFLKATKGMRKTAIQTLRKTPIWKLLLDPLTTGLSEGGEELSQGWLERQASNQMWDELEAITGQKIERPKEEDLRRAGIVGAAVGATMGALGLPVSVMSRSAQIRQAEERAEIAPDAAPVTAGQAIPPAGAVDTIAPADVTLPPITAAEAALPPAEGVRLTEIATPRLIQAAKPDRQVVSQEIMHAPAVTALPESQRVAIATVLDDANIPLESLTPEGLEDLLQKAEPPPPAPPTAAERVKAITEDIKGRDDPELTAKMKSWKKKAKKEGWNDEVTAQGLEALVGPTEAPAPAKAVGEAGLVTKSVSSAELTPEERIAKSKATPVLERDPAEVEWIGKYMRSQVEAKEKADAVIAQAKEDALPLTQYVKDMPAMQRGKILSVLNKDRSINRKPDTQKDYVEREVPKGAKVVTLTNGRRALQKLDGSFLYESDLSKAALDYAEHLITTAKPPAKPTAEGKVEPLAEQAKKYKTAEEFVEAQPTAYHGTSDVSLTGEKLDPRKAIETKGAIFFTSEEGLAEQFVYPREYGEVITERATGKFDESGEIYEEITPGPILEAKLDIKNPLVVKGKEAQNVIDDTILQGKYIKRAKNEGYDGIVFKDVSEFADPLTRGDVFAVFDKSQIKTKSQLTDIWNKAQAEPISPPPTTPLKPIAPSPPTKPYIPVQGESLIPTKGAGEGALTFEVRYKTKDGKTGTTIIEAKDAQIASNEVQKQFDAEGTGETVTLAVKSETDMVGGIVESLEQAAQELPEFAPKAPSPYADIAVQIVSIIQNRPVIAAETDQNLAVESENKRIGETAKPRNIVTPAIPPNPVDVKASEIYNKNMAEQYRKKKVADLTLRQIGISDTVDVMGEIETTTGEHGVLDAGRGVDRGRHVQEKKKIAFLEGLERVAGSSIDDIYLLESDEVQKAAIQRYLETKEGREDINPHWLGIVDYLRDYMYEEIGPKVKYLRTKRYCVDGKTKGWTPEQEVLLAPLREAYLRTLEDGTTTSPNNAYTIARDEFLASPDSSILLHENYLPHNKTDVGGVDDAVVFAHSLVRDYKDNRPPPTRSQSALQVREDNRPMDEIVDNPLIHLINHIARTEVNYYLGEPLNALHAKLITGVYADGRLANKASIDAGKGVPIVSKYTQNYLQKWYANLMGMRPPPNVWETLLYRARGNLWKAIAFGVWLKEPPQRFFSGVNDPRYVKLYEFGTLKQVREKVDAEIKAMFPDDSERMLRDLDYDVLLGRMIARELGAQGKDQLNSFKEHGWRAAITVPAHIMTDNAFIHWLNRIPIVGGDQHCDWVVNSDALNRTTGWIEWVRKGKDFILDRNLNYEELKGPMRLNRLNDAERALFVKMLVSGQRIDALLYNAERQVTIANFRYDQKLSSFFEQSTVGRHLSQYSKWWRGLSSLVWRDWRSVTHQDWLSEDPIRQRVNGVKTFVTMAALYTMSNLIYRYFTGNWDEGEDDEATIENFWRNYRAQFRVGPYAPTILGNVNTLATPINMLYRFEARGEMPAQVLESFKNLSSLTVGTTMNLTRAYLYRLEGMSSGDEKAYEKADELLWKTTKDAMKKGRSYFLQYSAISKWLFKIMDKYGAANPVGYPVDSGNWFRAGIDKVLEQTGAPEWWKWYEPEESDEESQWEKIAGVVFRMDKPPDKEEKIKPVVPLR